MKKFYYLLASIVLFIGVVIACVNPSIEAEELQAAQDEFLAKPNAKVTICHFDADVDESYQITISVNGLNGHNGHEFDNIPLPGESLVDSDNDGIIDCADCNIEGAEGSMKSFKYYRDADNDGFGDPDVFILKCEEGEPYYMKDGFKYILDGSDCDDGNESIYPDLSLWDMSSSTSNAFNINLHINDPSVIEGISFNKDQGLNTGYQSNAPNDVHWEFTQINLPYSFQLTYTGPLYKGMKWDFTITKFENYVISGTMMGYDDDMPIGVALPGDYSGTWDINGINGLCIEE